MSQLLLMRELTRNEIARTSFKYYKDWNSSFGYKTNRDKNEMCPYCKNEDTDIIRDAVSLRPFQEYYKDMEFKVMSCYCCNAVFSYGVIDHE